ncbi:hypothetical protein E7T09_18850 [Deinococcus sp. KSM4-11]|uniref:hypothetical protein n=1 Tax=Deinococcus sp. KSM4-11 TaxID=2568654 RepID=UPI0010A4E092|nr:hypothetical protein [Deinococcus sp. KSM4-11]THF85090.1 hypothetical protein E7T09_18850 [Deinococcus sp. KSM4-11]
MQHTRTWSDVYGSACAEFEGRTGGHVWLVAAPPDLAGSLAEQVEGVDGKGRVILVVHDGLTPLLWALRDTGPHGVLVVAPEPLSRGPALSVPHRLVDDAGGVEYQEGGTFPAWTGAGTTCDGAGECAAASAVASLELPVVVTMPDNVRAALEAWMDRTPHGR